MERQFIESSVAIKNKTRLVRADPRRLGEIIQQYTEVTDVDVRQAVERSLDTGLPLGEQLVKDGKLSQDDLAKCLSVQWGLPFVDLRRSRIPPPAVDLLDRGYQQRARVLVLRLKDAVLSLGIVDPLSVDVLDEIRLMTGYDVKPMMVSAGALQEKYQELFGVSPEDTTDLKAQEAQKPLEAEEAAPPKSLDEVVEDLQSELGVQTASIKAEEDVHDIGMKVDDVPVIRLVNSILADGIRRGASDIHFQPELDSMRVRYRVDGILRDGPKVPRSLMRVVQARVKVMAGLDFANRMSPQDGRMSLKARDRSFEVRVSVLPGAKGPKVVLRLAEQRDKLVSLEQLGFQGEELDKMRKLINRPYGMILITGPTGSGKTTTLYSAIAELNSPDINILTVEDPVEYQIPGVTHTEIHERAGLSFAACLRAALRQDPDIIMVGEIRDEETAEIATHASLTGHLVLSTLHTNDAPSAVTRLVDMGIQRFLVSSSVIGVLAQRLVRKLCVECKEPYLPSAREIEGLLIPPGDGNPPEVCRAKGCATCLESGYKGRLGIFELLVVSDGVKRMILEQKSDADIRLQAEKEGMVSLMGDVSRKVLDKLTTIEEAHSAVFV
jgi:type II secretory ATPase GspE/PulE/Tfp pilus assembly ATPase PilB-like protein